MFRLRPIALIALLLAAAGAVAQDWAEMSPGDQQTMMQEWTKLGTPGEAHRHLAAMTGYDNYKNMHISTWQDDGSTTLTCTTGSRHPQTGVFTFYGQVDEPMLEVQDRTIKYSVTIASADGHVFVMDDLHAGDDDKVFEIVYERMK